MRKATRDRKIIRTITINFIIPSYETENFYLLYQKLFKVMTLAAIVNKNYNLF